MIEEQAVIVKIDAHTIWIEKSNYSGCVSCQHMSSCTTQTVSQLLKKKSLRLVNTQEFKLGDTVTITIDENLLLCASISMYLYPILALFLGAFIADGFIEDTNAYKDLWVIISTFISFIIYLIGIKQSSATRYTNSISLKKIL